VYDLEAEPYEFREHWVRAHDMLLKPNRFGVRINDAGPVWMGLLNDTFKTPGAGNILATAKGGYILHMLRCLMWDPKTRDADFQAMMQDYVKVFANRAVSTEEFQWMVEKHMKPEMDVMHNHRMDWFFREWVYGAEVPSYGLEYSITREKGGKITLSGKLTQSGVTNTFAMAVPVFGQFGAKKVRLGVLEIHGNSTATFKVDVPETPKHVLLNINHEVLSDHEEVKAAK
jgi:aminopeptidase N